jgi:hypothetical protein
VAPVAPVAPTSLQAPKSSTIKHIKDNITDILSQNPEHPVTKATNIVKKTAVGITKTARDMLSNFVSKDDDEQTGGRKYRKKRTSKRYTKKTSRRHKRTRNKRTRNKRRKHTKRSSTRK